MTKKTARSKFKVAIILILVLVTIFACFLSVTSRLSDEYADFTRFQTSSEVETYLRSKLPIGEATKAQTALLLSELEVNGCSRHISANGSQVNADGIRYDSMLICRTNAPKEYYHRDDRVQEWLMNTLISWFYDLRFYFLGDTLVAITIDKANLSF